MMPPMTIHLMVENADGAIVEADYPGYKPMKWTGQNEALAFPDVPGGLTIVAVEARDPENPDKPPLTVPIDADTQRAVRWFNFGTKETIDLLKIPFLPSSEEKP